MIHAPPIEETERPNAGLGGEGEGPVELSAELVMRFVRDPVMAATVIMGAKLDVFQRARLRYYWFCPAVIDSGGVSTAKSEVIFIWACLRIILLTNPQGNDAPHSVAVFYQNLAIGEETFWKKFDKYRGLSKLFERQLIPKSSGDYGKGAKAGKVMPFRNGGQLLLLAGSFATDSKSMASLRVNDVIVDEYTQADKMGDGINMQIRQRATAACFNKNHPVWANHFILLGHAEDPMSHPSYKRIKAYKRRIADGSTRHALFTACYRDYTPAFAKYLPEEEMRDDRLQLTPAEFSWVWEGLWAHGAVNWYAGSDMKLALCDIEVAARRRDPNAVYILGDDTAPGMTNRADFNAKVVWEVKQLDVSRLSSRDRVVLYEGKAYALRPVYGLMLRGQDVDQLSGLLHRIHRAFGLARIIMDGGGGGAFVYKKMREDRQYIDQKWVETQGLCTMDDSSEYPTATPIVSFFKRGEQFLDCLWEPKHLQGDDGIIDGGHYHFASAWQNGSIQWPKPMEERSDAEKAAMSHEEAALQEGLDEVFRQISQIKVQANSAGDPVLTKRGFRKFITKGKKDGAMAAFYGFLGAKAWIEGGGLEDDSDDDEDLGIVSG